MKIPRPSSAGKRLPFLSFPTTVALYRSTIHGQGIEQVMDPSIETERHARIAHLLNPNDTAEREFKSRVAESSGVFIVAAERALRFSMSLDYRHEGQTREQYLAHPFRVATLYLLLEPAPDPRGVMVALVHNALEVTDITIKEIAAKLGRDVADALGTLTVDRAQEDDANYKTQYYYNVSNAGAFVGAVKVVDKLDNLYLLSLDPDRERRRRYLAEIEQWVLPLAEARLPKATERLRSLVANNRCIGHVPLDRFSP